MELMPQQFWRLTVREFWIKHDAFLRKEGREEAARIRQAMRTHNYKANIRGSMQKQINGLVRYPIKPWLIKLDT